MFPSASATCAAVRSWYAASIASRSVSGAVARRARCSAYDALERTPTAASCALRATTPVALSARSGWRRRVRATSTASTPPAASPPISAARLVRTRFRIGAACPRERREAAPAARTAPGAASGGLRILDRPVKLAGPTPGGPVTTEERVNADEQLVIDRCDEVVAEHDPKQHRPADVLGAQ